MSSLVYSLTAVILVSLISLVGLFALSITEKILDRLLFILVSFAGGAILGAAFFDLIPEAVELLEVDLAIIYVAIGFVSFYLLERSLYWYHGHGHFHEGGKIDISEKDERTGIKRFTYLNLLGDAVHNLLDGMVIGASFIVSVPAGIVTTLGVTFHELPQEIGDFAILVYGGFGKIKALMMNFLTALTALIGVVAVYVLLSSTEYVGFLVSFAGGGFTYLSAAELIPELQKERSMKRSAIQFVIFVLAMVSIWTLVTMFHE